jgi:hypothetical protein
MLRDGLPGLDRQRGILIGEFPEMLGDESLARHRAHGGKQQGIGDATGLQMPFDHEGTVTNIRAVQYFGVCGHGQKTNVRNRGSTLIWIRSSHLQKCAYWHCAHRGRVSLRCLRRPVLQHHRGALCHGGLCDAADRRHRDVRRGLLGHGRHGGARMAYPGGASHGLSRRRYVLAASA